MKIILISLLLLFLIGISSYSYAQYTADDRPDVKVPKILLQLELRNSDGNLITYIETEQITQIYPLKLNKFLDNQNHKELLIKDGKAYEKIQWQGRTEKFDKRHAMSMFQLFAPGKELVLLVNHNSYQVQPEDTIRVFWTIIRPAN